MLTVQYPGEPGAEPGRPPRDSAARRRRRRSRRASTPSARIDRIKCADRGRSLPAPPHDRHLRAPARAKTSARVADAIDEIIADTKVPEGRHGHAARHGAGHARVLPSFALGSDPRRRAALPDPGRAVPVVRRSVPHSAGRSAGPRRRDPHAVAHRHDAERHVADGRRDAGRHRGLEQHPDRRVHAPSARARAWRCAKRSRWPAASGCARC